MNTSEAFLIAILIIFALPYLAWRLLRTDYFAPLVVVQIIGGVLLGPGVLGAAVPGYYAFVFRPDVMAALTGLAWWAVMLFVFVAGIELDLQAAWRQRGETLVVAGMALTVPLVAGSGAALLLIVSGSGWVGATAQDWQAVLGIGMSCAVTALPILLLLMQKLEILRRPLGQRILRYASVDDVAIWGVLALILLDWERIGRQAGFIVVFAIGTVVIRRVIAAIPDRDRWPAGLIWLAASGFTADWAGLHYMVGAFLAGAVLDARWFGADAIDRFRDVILLVAMPVFFLSTGLKTSWSIGGTAVFGAAVVLLAASVGGKLVGVGIAGRFLGWRRDEVVVIGGLLQTKGLIMIIFANILLDKQIITSPTFTALLIMALASTMLTTPLVTPRLKRDPALIDAEASRP